MDCAEETTQMSAMREHDIADVIYLPRRGRTSKYLLLEMGQKPFHHGLHLQLHSLTAMGK
jgi:hypothetical protein